MVDELTSTNKRSKRGQADLALLRVHNVVLDVAHHPFGLRAAYPFDAEPSREIRVFSVGFESAARKRIAGDIEYRRVKQVVALEAHFVAHSLSGAPSQ